jgi:hypothetical protein
MDLTGFDANEHKDLESFDPIPNGEYLAVITDSAQKDTRSNTGWYLALTFTIIEGEHEGRKLWSNLNLSNPNDQAVEIAQRELATICRAIDVTAPKDSEELHDKPLLIKVTTEKRKDTGELTNRIKAYGQADSKVTATKKSDKPWTK